MISYFSIVLLFFLRIQIYLESPKYTHFDLWAIKFKSKSSEQSQIKI